MYWAVGEQTAVDTDRVLLAAQQVARAAQTVDAAADAALQARSFTSEALAQPGIYSPSASRLEAALIGAVMRMQALGDEARSLSSYRATAAMIYASAEENAAALFAACQANIVDVCGLQKWGIWAGLGHLLPPAGTALESFFGALSIGQGVRIFSGRYPGRGGEAILTQRQVGKISSQLLVFGSPLLQRLYGKRSTAVQITSSPLAGFGAFSLGTKLGGHYARADADGIVFEAQRGEAASLATPVPTPIRLDTALDRLGRPAESGVVEILKHERADGNSWSVLIRGTKEWTVGGKNPQDMLTNLQEVAGQPSAQRTAVLAAMEMSGIQPGDPVELIGHSQGGIVATNLGADPAASTRFNIAAVVTAGSPVALAAAPRGKARALHLENLSDIVPGVEGKANPPQKGRLTVYFSPAVAPAGASAHSVETYRRAATDLENGQDGSGETSQWLEERRKNLRVDEAVKTTSTKYWTQRTG